MKKITAFSLGIVFSMITILPSTIIAKPDSVTNVAYCVGNEYRKFNNLSSDSDTFLGNQQGKAIDYVRLDYVDKGMNSCVAELTNSHRTRAIIVDVYTKTDNTLYAREKVKSFDKTGVTASMCFASCISSDCKKSLYIKSAKFAE